MFLYEAVGWNVYLSAACILGITAVYTVLGNYKSTGIQLVVNKVSVMSANAMAPWQQVITWYEIISSESKLRNGAFEDQFKLYFFLF